MKTIIVPACRDEVPRINEFIEGEMEQFDCSARVRTQVLLAVEEIFVNIASYAYAPEEGEAEVIVDAGGDPPTITIRFLDRGKPFDPLAKPDADVTLSAEERGIGGLGIFLVKKTMDQVTYSYENGTNILTIQKKI